MTRELRPKVLAHLQALRVIVGADALAVYGIGPRQHSLLDQLADDVEGGMAVTRAAKSAAR